MGKITEFFKRKSIKTAFTTSMLVCIVSALLLSLALAVVNGGSPKFISNINLSLAYPILKW